MAICKIARIVEDPSGICVCWSEMRKGETSKVGCGLKELERSSKNSFARILSLKHEDPATGDG